MINTRGKILKSKKNLKNNKRGRGYKKKIFGNIKFVLEAICHIIKIINFISDILK